MVNQTSKCPVCEEVIEEGETSCKRCGFKFIGETQIFQPVFKQEPAAYEKSGDVPALEIVKGPYAGESFALGEGTFTIGRDPNCDIFLSNMTVSRHHATITISGGNAKISDEGSLNGTWVDGVVVDSAAVHPGTHVQVGTFEMVYTVKSE